ncbi:MAG: TIM-barrel domain-containing protein [Pseudomonadota bacterium]
MPTKTQVKLSLLATAVLVLCGCAASQFHTDSRAFYVESPDGSRTLRILWFGDAMVRLQTAHDGEAFLPDSYYEMIESHDWTSSVDVATNSDTVVLQSSELKVVIDRETLAVSFETAQSTTPILQEKMGSYRAGDERGVRFVPVDGERFTGLGHGYFARADRLDLSGSVVERNYGSKPIEQAPLIVPFYLSSRGYGVFLNSTFPNRFALNADGDYSIAIDTHGFTGQMDYVFIAGPSLKAVVDRYTQLTGRPRLPMKSMFGLQLSDKGHDHNSDTPSDETWWKDKIQSHRSAGLPLDHVVNDNRWRAAGGKRCESKIEWDRTRYPDPVAWARWLAGNGLVSTIDFNRCIAGFSDGWHPSFNLPAIDNIEFPESAPDLTNPNFRRWFWNVFYEKSLEPALGFPGDALWIDEFDEQGAAPKDIVLANGRSSAEMRNYWFFLIAKALVEEGWDRTPIINRPFVWVRGMTAGAQRYATLWSGDIKPNEDDMGSQIRAMQLAGLAGFPFWGHDAGGFFDWEQGLGPDESLYQRWAMAFGSFAPIWKPHGMGQSRWPLDRSESSVAAAHQYGRLRYELMPYLYSLAHEAADTGLPIARPMLLEFPDSEEAWKRDLQFMFGPSILVAPVVDQRNASVWLPNGGWYPFGGGDLLDGEQVLTQEHDTMPIYIRAGAIIPKREYALSTAFIDKSKLVIDVYTGADGHFRLVEDDDRTEAWRRGERRVTQLHFDDSEQVLIIQPAQGSYQGAIDHRDITVNFISSDGIATRSLQRCAVTERYEFTPLDVR